VTPEEAQALLRKSGAMLSGHFLLSSGRHSDRYVEKARVLERPETVMAFGAEMASWYPGAQAVVAPAVGAIALGFAVAFHATARFLFAERDSGEMTLRRGFGLRLGERTLVVEDVITTGASAGEVFDLVRREGADALGVAALVDRSQSPPRFPLRAVLRVEAVSWTREECPLCREGRPLSSPGSRRLGAEPSRRA
jgi:orotate phosphoribosyltransferase